MCVQQFHGQAEDQIGIFWARFFIFGFSVFVQVHFKWKVRYVNLRLYERVQNRFLEWSWVHLFVIRCKNIRHSIFVTFHSFGSIKTECNGGSWEIQFQNVQPILVSTNHRDVQFLDVRSVFCEAGTSAIWAFGTTHQWQAFADPQPRNCLSEECKLVALSDRVLSHTVQKWLMWNDTLRDFSRPLVKKAIVWLNRNIFCEVRTHFCHDAFTQKREVLWPQSCRSAIRMHKIGITWCFSAHERQTPMASILMNAFGKQKQDWKVWQNFGWSLISLHSDIKEEIRIRLSETNFSRVILRITSAVPIILPATQLHILQDNNTSYSFQNTNLFVLFIENKWETLGDGTAPR